MKASSSKAKGRRLQNFVRDKLLSCFPFLEQDDIKAAIMGESGEDIKLSPAARKVIPYSFECKNQERLNLWSSLEQAESNADDRIPVLIFKRNRSKTYVAIEVDSFLNLIQPEKEKSKNEQ
tara:strand:- start:3152 stop:3514 length:363 start_codon:yes stop_codon:yes gene_type:complete